MTDSAQPGKQAGAIGSEPPVPDNAAVPSGQLTWQTTGTVTPGVTPPPGTGAALPEQFGRYRIVKLLGRGGMGTVFLAHDTQIDRPVALKVPHAEVAQEPQALDRFYREARAAGQFRHPNLCPVFDVGVIDGRHYLAMAYIEGQPLAALVAGFRGQPERAAELVSKIARALDEAHRLGVIHRDLKPANIMIDQRGEPVVMDFGLARRVETGAETQTSPGLILGTPAYMPPEQALGDTAAVGPWSDVYSLGVILYELLTGRVPFQGTTTAVLVQIVNNEPTPPSAHVPGLDPYLEAVCLRAMARERPRRFSGMADLAEALGKYLRGEHRSAGGSPVASEGAVLDPRLVEESLRLLATWGWDKGLEQVRARLAAAGDAGGPAIPLLVGWLAGDAEAQAKAGEQLKTIEHHAALATWALIGQVSTALHNHHYPRGQELLEQAERAAPQESALRAQLAYLRGYRLARLGHWDEAVPVLHEALGLFGREHFLTGQVLDALGRTYAGKCNFQAAREFYGEAIRCKQACRDEAGLAMTREELGRLYLDWGHLDQAEEQLNAALRIVQKSHDQGGQAQVFNHLGRVMLARGEREVAAGRKAAARRLWTQAAECLDWSIRSNQDKQRAVEEGRTRKDRALLCLAEGNPAQAEEHLRRAEDLLQAAGFARGVAEVRAVLGKVRSAQERYEEAVTALRAALTFYEDVRDLSQAARTQLDLARTLQASGEMPRLVTEAFAGALERAEASRHPDLVRDIEQELKAVDEEAHWRHVYRRVRGRGAPEETSSLDAGSSEVATVLFLNLQGFMPFCQGMDPGEVVVTLNQILADLEGVLEHYRAHVTAYLGGGFMALLRGGGHAERSVHAGLDLLAVVAEFNRPRGVLGLRLLPARVGIASGTVFLGNIGTYHKLDFTAVGTPVNLASRLVRQGDMQSPCISQETRELVGERFLFKPDNPRSVELKGIGRREIWDVLDRKEGASSGLLRP